MLAQPGSAHTITLMLARASAKNGGGEWSEPPILQVRSARVGVPLSLGEELAGDLCQLRDELLQRSTSRARQLLEQVQSALNGARVDDVYQEPLEIDKAVLQAESKEPLPDAENRGFPPIPENRCRGGVQVESQMTSYSGKMGEMLQQMKSEEGVVLCSAAMKFGLFDLQKRKLIEPTSEWLKAIGELNTRA